jgi:hypothetical protein
MSDIESLKSTSMKNFICLFLLFASVQVQATIVQASSYGFDAENATAAFQQAVNSSFDTVVVDLQDSDWMVEPNTFFDLADKTIIFEPGVVLRALPGSFDPIYSSLMRFVNATNLTIIGYGAELYMDRDEYAALNDSEYRHSLNFFNCNGVTVKGLTIRGSGGDGIYIGGENAGGSQGYSSNLLIEDVKCLNHYRQGMSVVSAENLTVRHCLFSGTEGALPEAGVDIEPYETYQRVVNVLFENCSFVENGWSGFAVALFDMDNTSIPVSITVRDCYFRENCRPENAYALSEIHASADDFNPVQGEVLFERCFLDGSDYSAFYTRKTSEAYGLTFSNCVFRDVSRLQTEFNEPIFFEVPDYDLPSPALGGVEFNDVFLSYATDFNFFRVFGWSTLEGLADISGSFTVVEPFGNGILYNQVADTTNVEIDFTTQTSLPDITVIGSLVYSPAVECDASIAGYNLTRNSSLINYPLGVSLSFEGTATPGDDLHLMPEGRVIPAGLNTVPRSFIARNDGIEEPLESFIILVEEDEFYTSIFNSINLSLIDCLATGLDDSPPEKTPLVYPNPFTDELTVDIAPFESARIEVYTSGGALILSAESRQSLNRFNPGDWPAGIYFIRVITETGQSDYVTKAIRL